MMTAGEKALRGARLLHAGFFVASILYVCVPLVVKTQTREVNPVFVIAVSFVAMSAVGMGIFFRAKRVTPAAEALAQNPEDGAMAKEWNSGVVLSLVFCETTVLFGLVLRIMGTSWNISGLFYVVGILLMLAWTPKLDLLATR
jgi:F0F1-type ATP synthase membrane subunit c/vacuolar-type H+-ATPase subunit K